MHLSFTRDFGKINLSLTFTTCGIKLCGCLDFHAARANKARWTNSQCAWTSTNGFHEISRKPAPVAHKYTQCADLAKIQLDAGPLRRLGEPLPSPLPMFGTPGVLVLGRQAHQQRVPCEGESPARENHSPPLQCLPLFESLHASAGDRERPPSRALTSAPEQSSPCAPC